MLTVNRPHWSRASAMREPVWNRMASNGGSHDAATTEPAVVANGSPLAIVTTTETPVTRWLAMLRNACCPLVLTSLPRSVPLPYRISWQIEGKAAGVEQRSLRVQRVEQPGVDIAVGSLDW